MKERVIGILLLVAGLFLYVWPLVANAGAPYPANSPIQIGGLVLLLIGLCLSGACGGDNK